MTRSFPRKIQNLRSFTAQIRHINSNVIVGTGFVIAENGLMITCAHVVVAAGVNPRLGKRIPSHWELVRKSFFGVSSELTKDRATEIPVYFPQATEPQQRTQRAVIVHCFQDYDDDIVLLKLVFSALPEGVNKAIVDTAENSVGYSEKRLFRSYGYRRLCKYQGMPAEGSILDFCERPPNRILLAEPLVLQSQHIDSGMSGAAVLDIIRDRVIGIIAETSDLHIGSDRDTSFAVDYGVVLKLPSIDEAFKKPKVVSQDRAITAPIIKTTNVKPIAISEASNPQPRIDLSIAPAVLSEWVGRVLLLESLNLTWLDKNYLVGGLIGFGGEGKSSLARYWIEQLLNSELSKPHGVFWWSFYEKRNVEEFFERLLKFLNPEIELKYFSSTIAKIYEINKYINSEYNRYLFVLDGLEVLQHQEGDEYGLLINPILKKWLRGFAAGRHRSFCLITSRFPVLDMIDFTSYIHWEVEHLTDEEGLQLLKNLGVKGRDSDIVRVVRQWGGYALVLNLLGSYLVSTHNGEISQLPAEFVSTISKAKYVRVNKILHHYDRYLTVSERELLQVFSVFRLPITQLAILNVFKLVKRNWVKKLLLSLLRHHSIKQHESHIELCTKRDCHKTLRRLVAYQILHYNSDEDYFTMHPLLRNYYCEELNQIPSLTKKAHSIATNYYLTNSNFYIYNSIKKQGNQTPSSLNYLVEAVYHLCKNEKYDQAFSICKVRLFKFHQEFALAQIGAYETILDLMLDLAPLISNTFNYKDASQILRVKNVDKRIFILGALARCLNALGRAEESILFFERCIRSALTIGDLSEAARGFWDLALIYASKGRLETAIDIIHQASSLTLKKSSSWGKFTGGDQILGKKWARIMVLAIEGWIFFLRGDVNLAKKLFKQVNTRINLYISGYEMFELSYLLRVGELNQCEKIAKRYIRHWYNKNLFYNVAFCHIALGFIKAKRNQHSNASKHYEQAVKIARSKPFYNILIFSLLARGKWAISQEDIFTAFNDLEEALNYAVFSKSYLYEVDIRVGLAWAHFNIENLVKAKQEAERAKLMSEEMGYYWGKIDSEKILERLKHKK